MSNFPPPTSIRSGDVSKPNPFTILVVANPMLEAPWRAAAFKTDPIMANQAAFDVCVKYIEDSLFGTRPAQAETLLGDPSMAPNVRLLSLFRKGLPEIGAFSFVAQDGVSNLLIARRLEIRDFLLREGIVADIVYAVSGSDTHTRASAWFTTDDDAGPGVPFTIDGASMYHRHNYLIPGTIALPVQSKAFTAVHEFQHAISSYSNGSIVDLYVDSKSGLNIRTGRPIPTQFAKYTLTSYLSDKTRGPLTYPANWNSFHCELHDASNPAIMDNYWLAPSGVPEECQNDKITRMFVTERVKAKICR